MKVLYFLLSVRIPKHAVWEHEAVIVFVTEEKEQEDKLYMDKTIVISLLIFFLLLYIEWNNINSSNISFMFDHRFIPHHKFSVTSLFLFQPNVENKKCFIWFWLLCDSHERKW